jgi:hypothetical protein
MTDYEVVEEALAEQGQDIDDFSFFLTGVSSLEDAAALASDNGLARTLTRATTALAGGYEILAGMGINAGTVDLDFAALNLPQRVTIEFSLPDENCKNAVRLYRTFKGDSWTELPLDDTNANLPADIVKIETQATKIIVVLNRLRTQSFVLGVQLVEETTGTGVEYINANPVKNETAAAMPVASIKYNAKAGAVIKNEENGSLTDFLRKMIQKKNSLRTVSDATVEKEYAFRPVYQLPAGGTLFLTGWQNYSNYRYSIRNSNAAFTVTDYQAEFVYPYATYETVEPIETHSGGSSL